jgi:hypothetical protein
VTASTEELADEIAAQHRRWYRANPRGQLVQTCLIIGESGETTAVQCGWSDEAERALTIGVLRAMMVVESAVRYAVWSEVWLAFQKTEPGATSADAAKAFGDYRHGDLSRRPDRVEAIFTLVVEASGKRAHRLQRIVRGRSGGVRTLVDMEPMDTLGGALGDLLPERTFN